MASEEGCGSWQASDTLVGGPNPGIWTEHKQDSTGYFFKKGETKSGGREVGIALGKVRKRSMDEYKNTLYESIKELKILK